MHGAQRRQGGRRLQVLVDRGRIPGFERGVPDARLFGHFLERLRALAQGHDHVERLGAAVGIDARGTQLPDEMRNQLDRIVVLDVVLVDPGQLLEIEARGRPVGLADVEQGDHLLAREDFLVAVRPAEAHQIVQQRMRQEAVVAVLHDADRTMPLAELLAVRPEDHRQVGELRHGRAERVVDVDLARRVVDVIVAADHLADTHVDVVDDDREVVGREAVRAEQHEVVELLVAPFDAALDLVLESDCSGLRVLEPDHPVRIVPIRFVAIAVIAVVAWLEALLHGLGAHRLDFFLRLVGVVGLAGLEQVFGDLPVAIHAQGLVERAFVVFEAEPVHAVEDGLHGLLGRALAIGVLDAQDELATAMARLEPAVEGRAGPADMQETGGAGCEAGAYGHGQEIGGLRSRKA